MLLEHKDARHSGISLEIKPPSLIIRLKRVERGTEDLRVSNEELWGGGVCVCKRSLALYFKKHFVNFHYQADIVFVPLLSSKILHINRECISIQ